MAKAKPTAADLRANLSLYGTFCAKMAVRAQAHGQATAMHLFICMLNPTMRGSAFTWERFPAMAGEMAEASAHQGFSDREWARYGPLIEESAAHSARLAAEQCLRDSAVQKWLVGPP